MKEGYVKQRRNGKDVLVNEDVIEVIDRIEWNMKIAQFFEDGEHVLYLKIYRIWTEDDGTGRLKTIDEIRLGEDELTPGNLAVFARQSQECIERHGATKGRW